MDTRQFISVLIIVCSLIILLYGVYLTFKSRSTKEWSKTKGVVIKSEVYKETTPSGMDGTSLSFKTLIEYKYKADDEEHISKRVFYGDTIGTSLPFKSKKLIKQYPIDSEVIVYYNPVNPKESVLQKGLNFIIIEIYFLGSTILVIGFIFMFTDLLTILQNTN